MDKKESYCSSALSGDASNRRPVLRYLSGIAPGILRASLYLGLTYVVLFVGVGMCQGQSCGPGDNYLYQVHCADHMEEDCWSHDSDCASCAGYVYCGSGHGSVTGRQCTCYVAPNPDNLSIGGSVICAASGSNGWCSGSASLALTATDSQSHTVSLTGMIGGSGFSCGAPCTQNLPEGQGNISFTGTCSGGQTASGTASWKLDLTPPIIGGALSGGVVGAGGWYLGGPVTLSCTGSDALSGLQGISYSSQTANGDGVHNLTCTASDFAGNTAQSSQIVRIDGTAPVVTGAISGGTMGGGGWYRNGPVSLVCNATDATSGVAGISYDVMTATDTGVTNLNCLAQDNAGNTGGYSMSVSIDGIAPSAKFVFSGKYCPGGWYNSPVRVGMEVDDSNSGVSSSGFQVNGGKWVSSATLEDGKFNLNGSATDVAGNSTQIGGSVQVDSAPPTSEWTTDDDSWIGGQASLTGTSTDPMSGISGILVSTDNGVTWVSVGKISPWSFTWDTVAVPDGAYTLLARANDNACNQEHTAKLILNVDNTPPELKLKDTFILLGRSTKFFSFDYGSGLEKGQATINGNGIVPRVITFSSLSGAEDLAWDGMTGDEKIAPFGVYNILIEVWDKVGNHSEVKGTWVHPSPQAPTKIPAAINENATSGSPVAGSSSAQIANSSRPLFLPFWPLALPIGALSVWLAASSVALSRDRRWNELSGIRRTVNRYLDQKKINFPKGEKDD